RRLEDHLFVITQAMKIANHEHRPLNLGFLDISNVYEFVNHGVLWTILEDLGMPVEWRNLPQDILQRQQCCGTVGSAIHLAYKGHNGAKTRVPAFSPTVHVVHCKAEKSTGG
ncbi:hypothetical protein IscW_ISCW004644, partial [Ixodes scapularis]